MALADITEDDFTKLMHEEAEDVFIDGRVILGQGIVGGLWVRSGHGFVGEN